MGSSSELEYQLQLARDLSYLTQEAYVNARDELYTVKRMQVRLLQRLAGAAGPAAEQTANS